MLSSAEWVALAERALYSAACVVLESMRCIPEQVLFSVASAVFSSVCCNQGHALHSAERCNVEQGFDRVTIEHPPVVLNVSGYLLSAMWLLLASRVDLDAMFAQLDRSSSKSI